MTQFRHFRWLNSFLVVAEGDVQHLGRLADAVAEEESLSVDVGVDYRHPDQHDEAEVGEDGGEEDKVSEPLCAPVPLVEGGPGAEEGAQRGQVGHERREREHDVPVDEEAEQHGRRVRGIRR